VTAFDRATKVKPMKLTTRLMLMTTIVVSVTDLIEFYHLKQHPENLTLQFVS
jgi:hypothetical protein